MAFRASSLLVEGEMETESTNIDKRTPSLEPADLAELMGHGHASNAGYRADLDRWRDVIEVIPQVTALPDPRFTFSQFVGSSTRHRSPQENTCVLSQTLPWFGTLLARGDFQAHEASRQWSVVMGSRLAVEHEIPDANFQTAYIADAVRTFEDYSTFLMRLGSVLEQKIQRGTGQDEFLRAQVEVGKLEDGPITLRHVRSPLGSGLRAAMNWSGDKLVFRTQGDESTTPILNATVPTEIAIMDVLEGTSLRQFLHEANIATVREFCEADVSASCTDSLVPVLFCLIRVTAARKEARSEASFGAPSKGQKRETKP